MELPAVRFKTAEHNAKHFVTIEVLDEQWAALEWELATFKTSQACVKFTRPKKPRTTGPGSQSAHFHGHCMSIAIATCNTLEMVKVALKEIAMDEGYPGKIICGKKIPQSEADASTDDERILIETAHRIAAEEGIALIETEPEILSKPEGFYRDTETLKPDPIVRVKGWNEMTRDEQREADPARFDEEMQLEIF